MKVLFVHQTLVSFVKKDLFIISKAHETREILFRGLRDIPKIFIGTLWCDLTFSWFGKLHAFFTVFFCKILTKKSIVVAGGDDVVKEAEIKYGMFSFWWKRWCPLFVFHYADLILCVSEYNLQETIENAKANPKKSKLIYHGFDPEKFRLIDGTAKEQLVITVGGVDLERLERKGYERFVRSAANLPEAQFALIGQWHDNAIDHLREVASNNIIFTGRVTDKELLKWLSRAKVYVQASVHEGFGCSVAEAMLCECIPVVSRQAALPEVVGDCGFYLGDLNPESLAKQIKEALSTPEDLGKKARARIKELFPIEKRKNELLETIESIEN